MSNKKQIVFIEPKPTVNMYRIARSLKLTGKYKTILISFSDTLSAINVDKEFFGKAFDEISVLELNHKLKFRNLFDFFKKISSEEGKKLRKKIKKMKPYMFYVSGPDLFSAMVMFLLKKSPKIYYANDIWGVNKRNFLFSKDYWIKGSIQKFSEKICFKKANGALTKKSPEEFELLSYNINTPKMSLLLNCLDEWIVPPKKKKNEEIHFTFAGDPAPREDKRIPFINIIKAITSQKIYFHTYGPSCVKEEDKVFIEESKNNKYYCYHDRIKPSNLTKEMSEYTYGVIVHNFDLPGFAYSKNSLSAYARTDMSSRVVSDIESGLPLIVNKQNEYMASIVQKYDIGIVIDTFQDLKNVRQILNKKDYLRFQENIKKVQNEFKLSKKINEIESFHEKVINEMNKK